MLPLSDPSRAGRMTHDELRDTFESLLDASLTTSQLTRLANTAMRIAAALMRSRFRRYLLILDDAGYTAESAAARCVEALFVPQNGVACARLVSYIRSECDLSRPANEGDDERVLRRCVFLSVQQGIPDLLGEFDPQYRKILRMVVETISADGVYRREKGFFDDMISRSGDSSHFRHLPLMSADEIVTRLSQIASPDDSTQMLVARVFDILHDAPESRRIIPLGTLVTALRDFFSLYWKFATGDPEEAPSEVFEPGDADRLITPVIETLAGGVLRSYIERGQLTDDEASRYARAARDMLEDLAASTTAPWFEYHAQHFPEVEYADYRERLRGRFEYVLGSAKELFLYRCRKYFRDEYSAAG
ncbi:MAG: hypothetical protein RBU27_05695 [Bacteroidota bacterium]|nr:hypothetical protein [Bacteroidota bacterium]